MEFNNNNNAFTDPSLLQCIHDWLDIHVPPYHLFPMWLYYPLSSNVQVDEEDWKIRNLIWRFKGDPSRISYEEHTYAVSEVTQKVISAIRCIFGTNLKNKLMFFCVPTSSSTSYSIRFKDFSNQVCNAFGMDNGYDLISYRGDSKPKHLGGKGEAKYDIKEYPFYGKTVLLFDDVYTTGKSMKSFCSKLEELGANVIGGIVLGMTENDKCHEDFLEHKGYYPLFSETLW